MKNGDPLKRTFLITAAVVLALTAGCGAPAPEKDATYRDLEELVAAVRDTGLDCEGEVQEFPDGSSQYRTCGMNGWAGIYGTEAARDRQVETQKGSQAAVLVVGPNWIVKAPMGDAAAVQDQLGGTIIE